jgi:hypothetical protein
LTALQMQRAGYWRKKMPPSSNGPAPETMKGFACLPRSAARPLAEAAQQCATVPAAHASTLNSRV